MLFRLGIMDTLKLNFCKCLKKWVETNFKGTRTELGKYFNVSQGQISNVLACRKAGDETWRRFVAAKIGMDYDAMIGIEKPGNNIVRFESAEDKRHYEVIRAFEDKATAITINEILSDIEKLSPKKGLEKALDHIETIKIKIERDLEKKRDVSNDKQ